MGESTVRDVLHKINVEYFRPQDQWPAKFHDLNLRCLRAVSLLFGGDDLPKRNYIKDVSRETEFRVTVVLGPPPKSRVNTPREFARPGYYLRDLEVRDERTLVEMKEHRNNPFLEEYVLGSDALANLNKIQDFHVVNPQSFQPLVDSVDSQDLPDMLRQLCALGKSPPRMSNILIAANLWVKREWWVNSSSRQYAGSAARDFRQQEGRAVVLEKRVMSILGLALRRRYYFLSYALLKHDQYARSGLLLYMGYENEYLQTQTKHLLELESIPQGIQNIIVRYSMDPWYPHAFDSEAYSMRNKEIETKTRTTLYESEVMESVQVATIFTDTEIRRSLGGQITPSGDVFQPYHN
jgi:hypothetical protein